MDIGGKGELGPHLTQCRLGLGLPPYQVVSRYIQPFGHNRHGPKMGDVPFCGVGAESRSNTTSTGPRPTSVSSGILIHLAVWTQQTWAAKLGALFGEGEAGSPSNTKSPAPRPTSIPSGILIHEAIWPQQIWAKNWGAVPLWGRGAGYPSNTMWQGPRHICLPSFILIRPTVWPQCTNLTDRQTGQDNGPIA